MGPGQAHPLEVAQAADFVRAMPGGLDAPVDQGGTNVSGGQRQRLAIARAVLQNPRMLIFDEATSALDARTERKLCQNLFEAFRGRTVFFITHRLSTVRHADKIVLMDRGAIMEVGNHQQLMDLKCFLAAKCDRLIKESESWDKDQERQTYRIFALDVITKVL